MDSKDRNAAIQRVQQMEERFDELRSLWKVYGSDILGEPHFQEQLKSLTEYYEGPLWLSDYQADERGEFPRDLKRGILSQDGFYNFLADLLPL